MSVKELVERFLGQFPKIYANLCPIVANPSFALVPKGVYDTPIFEELLQRCELLNHFHFLFGAKICRVEFIYSIQSKITSIKKVQNDAFWEFYTKTTPALQIAHGH